MEKLVIPGSQKTGVAKIVVGAAPVLLNVGGGNHGHCVASGVPDLTVCALVPSASAVVVGVSKVLAGEIEELCALLFIIDLHDEL